MSYNPESYKHYDHRTHVYLKPDTYIGSDEKIKRSEFVYDSSINMIVSREIEIIPGIERIFLEILSNASDNVNRSRRDNIEPGIIEVTMNKKEISIKNGGKVIPLEKHPKEDKYIPELIFGTLLTSSNYEVERHEAGTNGIGAKAVNIFSKRFEVEISDKNRIYKQLWEDNMKICHEPIIKREKSSDSYVKISYLLDFERFSLEEYSDQYFDLFLRHTIDVSFNAKVETIFNNKSYNFSSILDYGKLYFSEEETLNNYLLHEEDNIQLIIFDTPNEGEHISFVNSLMTKEGGVHLEEAIDSFAKEVKNIVNEEIISKINRIKKRDLTQKEKRSLLINNKDIRQHISLILSVRVINPKFNSQSKNYLEAPKIRINIKPEEIIKLKSEWRLFEVLQNLLEMKEKQQLAKTDGKLKKYVDLKNGIDANYAGKSNRHKCILFLTEGKSGATYAEKIIALESSKRDYIGLLPLRGKALNVMKAEELKIENNKEIIELKKMLGLVEGTDYLQEENFNNLRYGSVMILADSDVDGKHIVGLIINFFFCRFPSLLRRGYVLFYRSPIIRAWRKKPFLPEKAITFYSEQKYQEWIKETPDHDKWHFKYYKGLATSNDQEIIQDHKSMKRVVCLYDDESEECIKLAFDVKLSDQRKDWISAYKKNQEYNEFEEEEMLPISRFFKEEFITYSIANIKRCIPSLIDGLKESERKVIFSCFKNWNIGPNSFKNYQSIKVAQLGADTARITNYHHGEESLNKVITKLSQSFVGSNNLPLLKADCQNGSRYDGGKNSPKARYMFVQPEVYFHLIFRIEDFNILNFITEEGKSIEPEFFYPIIPLCLINGVCGIATGYSTFIPNHNPKDIILWLKNRIRQKENKVLVPYYKGFNGKIRLKEDNTFISYGKYKIVKEKNVIIEELPIQIWPYDYHRLLEDLRNKKKLASFRDLSCDDSVYFEIKKFKQEINYKSLHLKSSLSLNNMVLLIENDEPLTFDTTEEILECFYRRRYRIYKKRKEYLLSQMNKELKKLEYKYKFVSSVLEEKIVFMKKNIDEIKLQLQKLEIPFELYENTKIKDFSSEELEKLTGKINKLKEEIKIYQEKDVGDIWIEELEELEKYI